MQLRTRTLARVATGVFVFGTTAGWATPALLETINASDLASFAIDGPGNVNGPRDIRAGKLVQSPQGKVIGTIKAVVSGHGKGAFRYALVATDSGTVAIPFWSISHLLQDGHIVIEPGLLAAAPRIPLGEVHGAGNNGWKTQANNFWRGGR
jgi:hypothetical protein